MIRLGVRGKVIAAKLDVLLLPSGLPQGGLLGLDRGHGLLNALLLHVEGLLVRGLQILDAEAAFFATSSTSSVPSLKQAAAILDLSCLARSSSDHCYQRALATVKIPNSPLMAAKMFACSVVSRPALWRRRNPARKSGMKVSSLTSQEVGGAYSLHFQEASDHRLSDHDVDHPVQEALLALSHWPRRWGLHCFRCLLGLQTS